MLYERPNLQAHWWNSPTVLNPRCRWNCSLALGKYSASTTGCAMHAYILTIPSFFQPACQRFILWWSQRLPWPEHDDLPLFDIISCQWRKRQTPGNDPCQSRFTLQSCSRLMHLCQNSFPWLALIIHDKIDNTNYIKKPGCFFTSLKRQRCWYLPRRSIIMAWAARWNAASTVFTLCSIPKSLNSLQRSPWSWAPGCGRTGHRRITCTVSWRAGCLQIAGRYPQTVLCNRDGGSRRLLRRDCSCIYDRGVTKRGMIWWVISVGSARNGFTSYSTIVSLQTPVLICSAAWLLLAAKQYRRFALYCHRRINGTQFHW